MTGSDNRVGETSPAPVRPEPASGSGRPAWRLRDGSACPRPGLVCGGKSGVEQNRRAWYVVPETGRKRDY